MNFAGKTDARKNSNVFNSESRLFTIVGLQLVSYYRYYGYYSLQMMMGNGNSS